MLYLEVRTQESMMRVNKIDFSKIKSLIKNDEVFKKVEKEILNVVRKSCFDILPKIENAFFYMKIIDSETEEIFSDSFSRHTGYSVAEIKKQRAGYLSIIDEEDSDRITRKFLEFESDREDGSFLETEYRIRTKQGEMKWLGHYAGLTLDGEKVIINSVVFDTTEFKQKLIELEEQVEKLNELNSAKDKFISIISHDLRAPFTSLLGFSEILLNEQQLSKPEQDEYLQYIYDASSNQLSLINYLLDWSRLQTGRINLQKRRLNVKSIISNAKSNLTGMAIRKNIEIIIDVDDELYAEADERLMVQAVANLLSNAIKFTPEHKSITVTAEYFKEGLIEIVVKDEGIGIPEKDQGKLFKLDEKFSMPGTMGEKGTGFGLTLVKEIVEKQGGDIWFYSKENEGTEFHFTVKEAKNLVLIVEDEESIRSLYRQLVKNELKNFEVIEAVNGYEALSKLLGQTPSLLIIDHAMPLMNGIQLIEAMREKHLHNDIPIIVVSGELTDEILNSYKSLGIKSIIKKPIDYPRLVEVVKNKLMI